MNFFDRNKLLEKEKLEIERVDLGNEDYVFVRQMTGRERDRFEQSLIKEKKDNKGNVVSYDRSLEDFRAKLAVVTLCDEDGKSLLRPEDVSILSQNMSAKRLETIINVAQRLNKISDEDKEALIKNSEAGLDDNSSSGCVENLE